MIEVHTNQRSSQAGIGPYKPSGPAPVNANTPNTWGRWANQKHYSLEVVQQPLRARMCGFGDKDRRPIAPAAVAKMVVKRQDDTLVDVDDVDCSFFLVTVDLWSGDGTQEMNLVLHPSSSDRYIPTHLNKPRRPRGSLSGTPAPHHTSPVASYAQYQMMQDLSSSPPRTVHANTSWGYQPPSYSQPQQQASSHQVLPSISSFNRGNTNVGPSTSNGTTVSWTPEGDASVPWGGPEIPFQDPNNTSFLDPVLRSGATSSEDAWPTGSTAESGSRFPQETLDFASLLSANSSAASYPQYSPPAPVAPSQPQHLASAPPQHLPHHQHNPHQRHTYTRTLVGPLSANACPLKDEHRQPGIFFLFQDLSVRTEGTFRLRLRLMNVGAPPAPESGATGIYTGSSPVLAQTFTEPFTVFSAKRFPGVPNTTALSIALGNQGQKIPLRNRHGCGKTGGRRRRGGSDSEDDSS